MKVTLNWLKQYVDFDWPPEELTGRLTMLGLEVEGVQKISGEFEGIVVAEVITREKHPNADKLSVCRVHDGQGERQIVCGAQNFKPGDKVPLILPGASLPLKPGEEKPFTIKVGKLRGVESRGMMCSHEELLIEPESIGLKQEDGLLILPDDAKVGQPFAEFLGRSGGDVVYDLEVTPNRPDWNSVIGIAREIAALTGNAVKIPEIRNPKSDVYCHDLVAVHVEDSDLCPRYTARVIKGVKIGPSPDWLRSILEKVGIRSISNVVDVTNFVMLEIGQPLHAFDYHLIARGRDVESLKSENAEPAKASPAHSDPTIRQSNDSTPTIIVRRAIEGEKFMTLDEQERTLTNDMLLIADAQKGIALAGVMGGQNTEINEQTVDVLIESAYFNPTNIRRTSKALGLRSESSYRFERGCDIGITDWASRRCAQLILETAGGQLAEGVVDVCAREITPREITLRHHKVNELLGVDLKPGEIESHLGALELKLVRRKARPVSDEAPLEPAAFLIPTYRVDLKREVDLIEEVARLHGVDKIPSTVPRGCTGFNSFDAVYDQLGDVRRVLTGLGLDEAQGQTLIAESEIRPAATVREHGGNSKSEPVVGLANPLSSDMDVLRPGLLPGLIHSLRHNINRKNPDVALFEIGRVFSSVRTDAAGKSQTGGLCHQEARRVAMALTGSRTEPFWGGNGRGAKFDVFDLKGIIEELLEHFGLRGVSFERDRECTELYLECARIALGGKLPLGEAGQLSPRLAKEHDLRDPVFIAELDLDQLLARRKPTQTFKPLPQFPAIRRDIAMLVPEATTHESVLGIVRKTKPSNLESVAVFDLFRGANVPEGQKSLAYAFTFRSSEKTLTDAEVNAAHAKIVEALKEKLKASVRE